MERAEGHTRHASDESFFHGVTQRFVHCELGKQMGIINACTQWRSKSIRTIRLYFINIVHYTSRRFDFVARAFADARARE